MICGKCGNQVPNEANFCPVCRAPLGNLYGTGNMSASGVEGMTGRRKIDNIFSAVARKDGEGEIIELILFIVTCANLLLSLATLLMMISAVDTDGSAAVVPGRMKAFVIFLMLFEIGHGVVIALRLKRTTLLCDVFGPLFVLLCGYFYCHHYIFNSLRDGGDLPGTGAVTTFIFLLTLISSIGLITILFIHMFSQYEFGKILWILSIVTGGLCAFLAFGGYLIDMSDIQRAATMEYAEDGISTSVISLLMTGLRASLSIMKFGFMMFIWVISCVVATLYNVFFFMGMIENSQQKFIQTGVRAGGQPVYGARHQPVPQMYHSRAQETPGSSQQGAAMLEDENVTVAYTPADDMQSAAIQCIQGILRGNSYPVQGEIIVGSQSGAVHIQVQESHVSRQHCHIRFNSQTNAYEVLDMSTNGTYLADGTRLPKGTYISCARGTIIGIGSMEQQFELL